MSRLDRAGHRACLFPFFLAATLARSQQHQGLTDAQLAALLRCSRDSLTHLRLCHLPATDQALAHIAHRFHVGQAALSALLSMVNAPGKTHNTPQIGVETPPPLMDDWDLLWCSWVRTGNGLPVFSLPMKKQGFARGARFSYGPSILERKQCYAKELGYSHTPS